MRIRKAPTPATKEAFAIYGQLVDGVVAQPVRAPEGARAGFGGLELTTSSTAFASLTDAMLQVGSYPYGCAEQRASRVLATLALFVMLRTGPKLTRLESAVLLLLYAAFVAWLALEGAGVISTLGSG